MPSREERRRKLKEEEARFAREAEERAAARRKRKEERRKRQEEEEKKWEEERAARRAERLAKKAARQAALDAEAGEASERRKERRKKKAFKGTIIGGRTGTRIKGTRIRRRIPFPSSPEDASSGAPTPSTSAPSSTTASPAITSPSSSTTTTTTTGAASPLPQPPIFSDEASPSTPTKDAKSSPSSSTTTTGARPKDAIDGGDGGSSTPLPSTPPPTNTPGADATSPLPSTPPACDSSSASTSFFDVDDDDDDDDSSSSSEEGSSDYETSETEDYEDALDEYEGFLIEEPSSIVGFLTNDTHDAVDLDVAELHHNLQYDEGKCRYRFENLSYNGCDHLELVTCRYEDRKTFRKLMVVVAEGHDNVRRVHGFSQGDIHFTGSDDRKWVEENYPFIVVDPVRETLEHFLKKDQFHSLREVVEGMLSIARGVEFVHAYGLAVGDLHVGKIEVKQRGVLSIAELLYFWCPKDEPPFGGTPLFQAPEILKIRLFQDKTVHVDLSADIFSLGYVLWQMIYKYKAKKYVEPDEGLDDDRAFVQKLIQKNYRPRFPPGCNSSLRKLIRKCWDKQLDKRPTASEVVKTLQTMLLGMGTAVTEVKCNGEGYKFVREPLSVGASIKDFVLTQADLTRKSLKAFKEKQKLLFFAPSVSMDAIGEAIAELDEYARTLKDSPVLVITQDLPFTLSSFTQGHSYSKNFHLFSAWGNRVVGDFNLELQGPITGISACAVYVLSPTDVVTFAQISSTLPGKPNLSVVKAFIASEEKDGGGKTKKKSKKK